MQNKKRADTGETQEPGNIVIDILFSVGYSTSQF